MVIKANRENGQQPGQQMRQNVHLGGMYYIVTETGWDHRNQSKSYSPPINVTYSNNNYSAVVQRSPAAEDTRASPVTK